MLAAAGLAGCGSNRAKAPAPSRLDQAGFRQLIGTLSDAWNTNNARMAADCFTEDALYSSPPNPQIRKGRQALFEFFGGEKGRPKPMSMLWHHVVFDENTQIGMAEYTLTYEIRTHGMAILRIVNGKIANWRQYEIESRLNWEELIGENQF
jgi:ketosteroid isomerase-like protein